MKQFIYPRGSGAISSVMSLDSLLGRKPAGADRETPLASPAEVLLMRPRPRLELPAAVAQAQPRNAAGCPAAALAVAQGLGLAAPAWDCAWVPVSIVLGGVGVRVPRAMWPAVPLLKVRERLVERRPLPPSPARLLAVYLRSRGYSVWHPSEQRPPQSCAAPPPPRSWVQRMLGASEPPVECYLPPVDPKQRSFWGWVTRSRRGSPWATVEKPTTEEGQPGTAAQLGGKSTGGWWRAGG